MKTLEVELELARKRTIPPPCEACAARSSSSAVIAKLEADAEEIKKATAEQAASAEVKAAIDAAEQGRETAEAKCSEMEAKCTHLEARIQVLEGEYEAARSEVQRLNQRTVDLEASSEAALAESEGRVEATSNTGKSIARGNIGRALAQRVRGEYAGYVYNWKQHLRDSKLQQSAEYELKIQKLTKTNDALKKNLSTVNAEVTQLKTALLKPNKQQQGGGVSNEELDKARQDAEVASRQNNGHSFIDKPINT